MDGDSRLAIKMNWYHQYIMTHLTPANYLKLPVCYCGDPSGFQWELRIKGAQKKLQSVFKDIVCGAKGHYHQIFT